MGKSLNGKELGSGFGQRKDGVYFVRYNDNGKRITLYASSFPKIKQKYRDALKGISRKRCNNSSLSMDEWFKTWMDLYKQDLKPTTKHGYEVCYKNYISPQLGQMSINTINNIQLQKFLVELKENGTPYSPLNYSKILLDGMFNQAVICGIIEKDPMSGITFQVKQPPKKEPIALTTQEEKIFMEFCSKSSFGNAYCVQLLTGLRTGELRALNWKTDINFSSNTIQINKTLAYCKTEDDPNYHFILTEPKTPSSNRVVKFNQQCAFYLKKQIEFKQIIELYNECPYEDLKDCLFVTKQNIPMTQAGYNYSIRHIIKLIDKSGKLDHPFPHIGSHVFRHTYATRCFEAGLPPKTVQKQLGHSRLDMTMNLYTHLTDEKLEEDVNKFSEYMESM